MKTAVFILCLLISSAYSVPTQQQSEHVDNSFWDIVEYHCGSELADEMDVVCDRKFTVYPAGSPMLSMAYRKKMNIPFIADECCRNPCSRKTLKQYC